MARILIADDEAAVREYVARAVAHFGHEAVTANDGSKALEALASGNFDALIADIVMPVMDGIALALKCAAEYPGLPVILMTGFSAEAQRAKNLESLVTAVIAKPFTIEEIGVAVSSALASSSRESA